MTPSPVNTVSLDELNDILNEMKKGEDAIKRLAEMDDSKGFTGKKKKAEPQEVGVPPSSRTRPAEVAPMAGLDGVLSDTDLAKSRLAQAEMMKKNAAMMLAEAEKLTQEAQQLDPTINNKNVGTTAKKKTTKVKAA